MVLAHIGLMKTASTSIQELLLEDERIDSRIHWQQYYTINCGDKEEIDDKIVFVSDENLSREFNRVKSLKQSLINLESYHHLSTILIVIREQFDFLASAYKHHIKQTDDYLNFKEWLESKAGRSQLSLCDYKKLELIIREVLPDVRVVFLPYELIKKDESTFLKLIYNELGIASINLKLPSSNQAYTASYYLPKLYYNRFSRMSSLMKTKSFERIFIWITTKILRKRRIKTSEILNPKNLTTLKNKFTETNAYISSNYRLDLKKLGYL